MSHITTRQSTTRCCWDCYFFNGETVAHGLHAVCHQDHPRLTVRAQPEHGCAFWAAVPAPGEPKPLLMSVRPAFILPR